MADPKTGKPELTVVGGTTVVCKFKSCKHSTTKYSFCKEHFEMFKFGLLNKNGEWVPDYEKKWDQFQNFKKAA